MPDVPALETAHLRKEFNQKVAVADLTLRVERGEVFGFLGPNGAGKTTAVKMLLGLITPTSGGGQILGAPLGDHRVRTQVGFLPEHFRFHDWLTGGEFLRLHASLYGMSSATIQPRVEELLDLVGLIQHREKKLREYSKGMLQRVGLAQALLNRPALVILDEPTSGLDPVGRRLVRDIIRDLRTQGTTVFLNSHLLSEVEITCDRVAFIKKGEVIRVSDLDALMDGELSLSLRARPLTPDVLAGLNQWSSHIRADGDFLRLTVPDEAHIPVINRFLVEQGVEVFAVRPEHISLEDLFIEIVGADEGL